MLRLQDAAGTIPDANILFCYFFVNKNIYSTIGLDLDFFFLGWIGLDLVVVNIEFSILNFALYIKIHPNALIKVRFPLISSFSFLPVFLNLKINEKKAPLPTNGYFCCLEKNPSPINWFNPREENPGHTLGGTRTKMWSWRIIKFFLEFCL